MKNLKRTNITHSLITSFSFLILSYVAYSLFTLYDIGSISKLIRTIYDHPLVVSNAALQADVSVNKMHCDMKDIILFNSDGQIDKAIADMEEEEQRAYLSLDLIRDRIIGDEGKDLERQTRILLRSSGLIPRRLRRS